LISLSTIMAAIIGVVVGLVMGLTGAGGGILAVPALVYSQGWSMQHAMPVALLAVTCAALIGTIEAWQKKLVRYRAAALMALIGAPFTFFGVQLAHQLSQRWLMAAFALILVLVAIRLILQLLGPARDDHERKTLAHIDRSTGRFDWSVKTGAVLATIGAMAGFVTGLLGVGGGFIIVPMLRYFTNVSMHGAVATSLLLIALVGGVGVGSSIVHGAVLPFGFTAAFVVSSVAGMLLGRRLVGRLPARTVQGLFAILLLLVAMSLAFKAWIL
jgi:uncharacterized membrane protein YfcA